MLSAHSEINDDLICPHFHLKIISFTKLSSSSLFLIKARRDSYPLQHRLHMTEKLLFVNKFLRFLGDLCSCVFRAGHSLVMFTEKNYKIPSKTLATCVKHDHRIVLKLEIKLSSLICKVIITKQILAMKAQ